MDKLQQFLLPRAEPGAETLLDRIVRDELKRRNLMKSVCSSHHTAGTFPVPTDRPKKQVQ